ncbi:MAG: UDP-N-acetylglucosamine--N-acetylmuramyl-(pentapeptide) pyrophosphoryl-undecaprenol N-acetylglucosamine transferase [Gemmatimonadales bacterium]|nr:UDP-N-acetylglucosamine--N-acetylmuramyl-(pentapeptide) pyrophosphoryl-undecaprenol N-acetylglucosamine transferase [Gemmatimonadales bacterium]MBP6569990.1 UDP-N-acetylglucosamine--N-acetylmuramyl-(pentapeptide) pyrophosphoryl-undecaprenol N-acetylglucosamine transferase [Gemmatimonadales bacterium]
MTTVLLAGGGTGGHLMPALAIAQQLQARHPEWRMVFAGAERGIEATVLPERGVPHRLFPFEPIHRRQWWRNLKWPLLAWRVARAVDRMLDDERPSLVIGTGGYVSGPVVWRAARRGIPTAILELDVRPGFATRRAAPMVQEIWTASAEGLAALGSAAASRGLVTGAPITPPDLMRRDAARQKFGLADERPVLVMTGGSQGSLAMNRMMADWLRDGGAADAHLIWATGRGSYQEFAHHHLPPDVTVVPFLDPMADAWAVADLCVARAGMMTLAELCAWGIPSVLVPLPTAAADHQRHNAEAMAAAGASVMLPQAGLTAQHLGDTLTALLADAPRRTAMATAARMRGKPDAAQVIAERCEALVAASGPQ